MNWTRNILFASALFLAAAHAFAHGDVHLRIVELTAQIQAAPTNASLYFQRGDLHRADGDWTNALADFDRVESLDRSITRVDYCRGLVFYEAGRPAEALAPLNRYLTPQSKDGEALALRAHVQMKLTNFPAAVADWNRAIAASTPSPELYISRAESWRSLGKLDEALRGLDEGIHALGPLVTLELPAVDIELMLKHFDAALARIDTVMARLQRKETWLVRRAEILKQAGRDAEAKANYREALAAIDRLPPSHRSTRMTLELETRIRAALGTNTPAAR